METGPEPFILGNLPRADYSYPSSKLLQIVRPCRSEAVSGTFAHELKKAAVMSRGTPEQVLKSIVDGINTGNLDAHMTLYESDAAFASQPGSLAHGVPGVRESLAPRQAAWLSSLAPGHSREPGQTARRLLSQATTRMCCVVKRTVPGAS